MVNQSAPIDGRFALMPFGPRFLWIFGSFTAVFVGWVPLAWFYGNITDRSAGAAIFFFSVFALFMPFWIGGIVLGYQRSKDPNKNYLDLTGEDLVVRRSWAARSRIHLRDVESIQPVARSFAGQMIVGLPAPNLAVRLRRPSFTAYFRFNAIRTIELAVSDPSGVAARFHEWQVSRGLA